MNLTGQLRIILLLVGVAVFLGIYWLGKRRSAPHATSEFRDDDDAMPETTGSFTVADELDEDELETPAYLRRQGQREVRQDYEPRIAVDDYAGNDAGRDHDHQFVDIAVHDTWREVAGQPAVDAMAPVVAHTAAPAFAEPVYDELPAAEVVVPAIDTGFDVQHEPRVSLDDSFTISSATEPQVSGAGLPDFAVASAAPVPVMAEPVVVPAQSAFRVPDRVPERADTAGITPTVSDVVSKPAPPTSPAPAAAKTANSPAARRKIIALRLPMAERVPGSQLLSLLQGEKLQHGKFNIFHRLHDAQSVFSVASMVEPGSFDPRVMYEQQFPGVTLFMLLPGPLDGLVAYDQMLSCAQRLAHATGGVLQDERGGKLTAQTVERLREEVLDFQHLVGSATATS